MSIYHAYSPDEDYNDVSVAKDILPATDHITNQASSRASWWGFLRRFYLGSATDIPLILAFNPGLLRHLVLDYPFEAYSSNEQGKVVISA